MKQLNYIGKRKFEWFDVPEPTITAPDQVIGKPIVMGRCDGDVTASLPGIAGVLEAGNQQKMIGPMVHHCLGNNPDQPPFPIGMVSDYILIPFADRMLTQIPSDIDPLIFASASDNLADTWRSVAPALQQDPQQGVCVLGGGAKSIGIYAAALAVALGSPNVVYLDFAQERLDIATAYGARAIKVPKRLEQFEIDTLDLGEFNIGVEASSNVAGFNFLFDQIA